MTEKDKSLDDESELALRLKLQLHESLVEESNAWDTINVALGTITRARAEQSRAKEALRRLGVK